MRECVWYIRVCAFIHSLLIEKSLHYEYQAANISSSFQGLLSTQTRHLGHTKVSCLWRCPQFRGVLIEELHCIYVQSYYTVIQTFHALDSGVQ